MVFRRGEYEVDSVYIEEFFIEYGKGWGIEAALDTEIMKNRKDAVKVIDEPVVEG